jgi:membrane carboxypeptidase/penicillin-binding protein PbpC
VLSIPKHYKETFFIAEAIPGDKAELLYWHLNDRYLGSTHQMPHQMKIAAPEGNYRLKVINEKGLEQIVSFVIQ